MHTRLIQTDGLCQQVLEAGPDDGPLVLLIHGFPELGISWRAQVEALGNAGYRAVAPDMRGYGGTDKPAQTLDYSILNLVGDMVDLVRALGRSDCFVVGHDWGAPVAWHCALLRPDLFRAVFGLSVPFQPRRAKGPPTPAMTAIAKRLGRGTLYMTQFQAPDAHAIFETDVPSALRKGFYAYDGAAPEERQSTGFIAEGQDFISEVADDATLPPWMSAEHFAEYVTAFSAGGFKGPMDWYRCLDLNWSLTAFLQDQRIVVPSAFMVGERDPVRHYAGQHEGGLKDWLTDLRSQTVLPGAGHWIQQERSAEVTGALLNFFEDLRSPNNHG
ncbi:alpha/beta fold hydrolase [Brevundimonas variabilis]|uniref:Pimeloyl-ACP methyl ester carboxylesterase n=1 Tax=Brevundimonas variabilis TaxID=74312 RepID=A0A7W9CFP5_9CAUL|nr:alpha/beta hydrolase [Brevundimonas variabilis]MBB5744800.1 pimeloyl-ACP methyl ester carboxylesterase [Brevundimonas variabilis]